MTLEAWVNPRALSGGGFRYIIGKGRTGNPGFAANNQNYALRLTAATGALSFLFRSVGKTGTWHRWTSRAGVGADDGWHHVAITYTFGKKNSLRGYIDGEPVSGKWDMGGATTRAPVVDDDELRIGASFDGLLDEVAIYRTSLPAGRIRAHYRYKAPDLTDQLQRRVSDEDVLVDIIEGIPDRKSWRFRPRQPVDSFRLSAFGLVDVPNKYSKQGLIVDRSQPFLIRAAAYVTIPRGPQRLLIRGRNASRLYMDGKLLLQTPFFNISSSAHGEVHDLDDSLAPHIRPLRRGDSQRHIDTEGDGRPHLFVFEEIIGGQRHRAETGETSVSIGPPGGDLHLLSATRAIPLTDEGWRLFATQQRARFVRLNTARRREAGREETRYWQWRHQLARHVVGKTAGPAVPAAADDRPVFNDIDRFINRELRNAGERPTALTDDNAFQRRVTLDVIGTIPTPEQIRAFRKDRRPGRRSRLIDRLLEDPHWADQWVGYWQDVLAENPNFIKPTLNNTGPFRWWIYESFLDNKPFDRFATELVMMEGSRYSGGPAGFEMATQNDAPLAAKARILGQAFLGLEMKCARCHDHPYRDFTQRDLFSLAAMLRRGPQNVPATSSIPGGDAAAASLIVTVSLKPGERVSPVWPFDDLNSGQFPDGMLRKPNDTRERLAALITSPNNKRFARVIANRLWRFYLGRGLVESVDDWENAKPSHPNLLDYLARELILHDYNLKHLARLILNSHTYQRTPRHGRKLRADERYLFAAPLQRRMRAEQIVDSLFLAAGKPFDAGAMTIDIDGALRRDISLNLGEPTRAWQFTSLSNERDRPSLALPFAQPFVTLLGAFGWRSSRQDPLTVRSREPTVRQPAAMANGLLARRIVRLSDDSAFTELALKEQSVDCLIRGVSLRLLSRPPTTEEQQLFKELLTPGFDDRRVDAPPVTRRRLPRGLVSWSNHLNPRANRIKLQLQRAVDRGDPPTRRLKAGWRERLEDMLWAMVNSPEFVFIP